MLSACAGNSAGNSEQLPTHTDGGSGEAGLATVQPGVCYGADIHCSVPEFPAITSVPEMLVECMQGPDLEVVWSTTLGTFDCGVPGCPAANPVIALGGGHFWGVADVREPGTTALGSDHAAYALVQYDDVGTRILATLVDPRARLQGPFPKYSTRVVDVNAAGVLLWAAPLPNDNGIELRKYGLDGQRLAATTAVSGVSSTDGHVVWSQDGSATVAYRYPESLADGGMARMIPGIARFGPSGRLLWNQSLFTEKMISDPGLLLSVSLGGVTSGGETIVRLNERRQDMLDLRATSLLELSADGNVAWAHDIPNAKTPIFAGQQPLESRMRVEQDGRMEVLIGVDDPQGFLGAGERLAMEQFAAEGSSTKRLRTNFGAVFDTAAFRDGLAVLAGSRGDLSVGITVLDANSSTCTEHVLNVPSCLLTADGTDHACGTSSLLVTDSGYLYFGIANTVGKARLP